MIPAALAALAMTATTLPGPGAHAAPVPAGRPLPPEPDPKPTDGDTVVGLAYSPARRLLAVLECDWRAGDDPQKTPNRLTLFDAATHAVVRRLSASGGVPATGRGIQFAPGGGSMYLNAVEEGAVYTCDLPAGTFRKRFDADSGFLVGFTLSPDGKRFVTSHIEAKVGRPRVGQRRRAVWDANTFQLIRDIQSDVKLAGAGVFAPDGKAVAFGYEMPGNGGGHGLVELDPVTWAESRRVVFTSRTAGAVPIASPAVYSPDGRWLVLSGGEGIPVRDGLLMRGYVRIWDRATGGVRTLGDGKTDYFRAVALSADGKRLYAGTRGTVERTDGRRTWLAGEVHCWDTADWKKLWSVETDSEPEYLAVTPSGRRLWVADRFDLRLLDADTGEPHGSLIRNRHE